MHPLEGWVMLICNPVSGVGRGTALLSLVEGALGAAGLRYKSAVTSRRGDAVWLARSAAVSGCSAVVVIGGDGTLFEAVNGIKNPAEAESSQGSNIAIGLIQAGRGSDFGRSAGIPSDVGAACARLLTGRTEQVDLGHVSYCAFGGEERARFFANAAGMGFDAEVTVRANTGSHILGGNIPYLSSLLFTLGTYRNKRILARLDDGAAWHARLNSIVVANGQYFGGGMKIAPDARISDGLFDVVVLGDLSKLELLRNVPRVYDGSHITHPKVKVSRARQIGITSPGRLLLQADGEVLGTAPAFFRSIPLVPCQLNSDGWVEMT